MKTTTPPLVHDGDVARHRQGVSSRLFDEIELLAYIICDPVAIDRMKEIARHTRQTPPLRSGSDVGSMTRNSAPSRLFLELCRGHRRSPPPPSVAGGSPSCAPAHRAWGP